MSEPAKVIDVPLPSQQLTSLPVPPAPSGSAALIHMIERAARDPSVDVDKMLRLLDVKKQLEAEEESRRFDAAMAEVQSGMQRVLVNRENTQTHSKYATFAALDAMLRPIYSKAGFSLSFNTGEPRQMTVKLADGSSATGEYVRVTCRLSHKDGCSREYHIDIPADGKGAKGSDVMTKTHAVGSAITYGRRYLLLMMFNIAVTDKSDDDGNAADGIPDAISPEQVAEIEALIQETGSNNTLALRYFKIEQWADLPVTQFSRVITQLSKKRKAAP